MKEYEWECLQVIKKTEWCYFFDFIEIWVKENKYRLPIWAPVYKQIVSNEKNLTPQRYNGYISSHGLCLEVVFVGPDPDKNPKIKTIDLYWNFNPKINADINWRE